MRKQSGFTLIELMIVVAVIGILSAIAIPQYQKYVAKSEAATALASISALKTEVELTVAETGSFPSTTSTPLISTALGTIKYTNKSSGAGDIIFNVSKSSKVVTLSRGINGIWSCISTYSSSSEEIPTGCKKS